MRFLMIGQLVILQSGLVMLIPMEEMKFGRDPVRLMARPQTKSAGKLLLLRRCL